MEVGVCGGMGIGMGLQVKAVALICGSLQETPLMKHREVTDELWALQLYTRTQTPERDVLD